MLILIDVHYLQNVVFSFEKGSNSQIHYFSDSHLPPVEFPIPHWGWTRLCPLMVLGKPKIREINLPGTNTKTSTGTGVFGFF